MNFFRNIFRRITEVENLTTTEVLEIATRYEEIHHGF